MTTVALLYILVRNSSDRPIKNVRVTCRFVAASGDELSHEQRVIYQTFKAGSARIVESEFSSINPETDAAGCDADGADWAK